MSTNFSPTPAELTIVSQIFAQADPQKLGVLTGDVAVRVFGGAKLPPTTLGEIWNLSDEDNKGWLPKKGVAIAVRLIGWAQKGEKITQALANKPGPLAIIEGINTIAQQTTGIPKSPPPPAFPPLHTQDKAKFQNMFVKYGPLNGLLSGDKARDIFVKSKLSNEQLLKIWNLADTHDRGSLDVVDFAIGMYFIQGVMAKTITFIPTSLPPGLYQQAGGNANSGSVRSHATGGSGSFSPVSSAFALQHTAQNQMLQPEYTGLSGSSKAPNLPARPNPPAQSNGHVEWDVTPAGKAASDRHFDTLDTQRKGFIEGEVAVPFMLKSQLPGEILAQVWDLADINNDGCLTREGFAIAMHLIQKKLGGQDVPSVLPPSLVPPSKQLKSGALPFQPQPEPPIDLFSFDDTPPPSAGPMQTMQSTGVASPQVTTPTPSTLPPVTAGRAVEADPFSTASPFLTSSPHQDLLSGEALTTSPTLIHDQSAEIGNATNQLQSTSRSLATAKEERGTLEQALASQASQLSTLQTQLSSAKAAYETETNLLATLKDRHSTQLSEIQKTREELIRAESDLSAIRVEKSEIEGAFLRDKEEARDLHKRMVETGQQAEVLKADVEKLKKEAKQQKGLLAIARKQLSTKENEKARAEKEHEDSLAEVASITQEKEVVEGEVANLATFFPVQKVVAFSSPSSSLVFAAAQPLPATPTPDIPSPGGKSNNPFERLAMASGNSSPIPRSQSPFLGTFISSPPLSTPETTISVTPADLTPKEATKPIGVSSVPDHGTEISYLAEETTSSNAQESILSANATEYFVTPPTSALHDNDPSERFPSLDDLSSSPPMALESMGKSVLTVPGAANVSTHHQTDLNTRLKEMEVEESDSDEETDDHHIDGRITNSEILSPPIPLLQTLTDSTPLAATDSFDDVFASDGLPDKPLSNGDLTPFDLSVSSQSPTTFLDAAVEPPPAAGVNEFDEAIGKLPSSVSATPATFSFDTTFEDNFDFASASASNDVEFPPVPAHGVKGKSPGNVVDSLFGTVVTPSEHAVSTNQLTTPVTANNVPNFESSFGETFPGFDSVTAIKLEDKPNTTAVQPQDVPGSFPSPLIHASPKVAATSSRVVEARPVSPPPRAVSPTPRVVSPKPRMSSSSSKEIHEKVKETNVRHSKISLRLPFGKKKKHQEPMPPPASQHLSPPIEQLHRTGTPAREDDVEPVKQLTDMGFSRGQAVDALEKYGYDVQKALNSLLGTQ